MTLKNRLERLESVLKVESEEESQDKQVDEYGKAWRANDPEGRALFNKFREYCIKSGLPDYQPRRWIELTRTDRVAAEMARKYMQSYRDYIKTHFGVITDEIGSTYREA